MSADDEGLGVDDLVERLMHSVGPYNHEAADTLGRLSSALGRAKTKAETILAYARGTIGPGAWIEDHKDRTGERGEDWALVHKGRGTSLVRQIEGLLSDLRDATDAEA